MPLNKEVLTGCYLPQDSSRNHRSTITREEFCMCIGSNGLKKEFGCCCMCGWDDASTDLAHIVAVKRGGEYSFDNIVPLCPNHHRLFDQEKLTETQGLEIVCFVEKIQAIIEKNKKA